MEESTKCRSLVAELLRERAAFKAAQRYQKPFSLLNQRVTPDTMESAASGDDVSMEETSRKDWRRVKMEQVFGFKRMLPARIASGAARGARS